MEAVGWLTVLLFLGLFIFALLGMAVSELEGTGRMLLHVGSSKPLQQTDVLALEQANPPSARCS